MEMERKPMMVSTPEEEVVEASKIEVYDDLGPLHIVGWKVADVSWSPAQARQQGQSRWTNLTLYRVENRPGTKYAVQITGRSSVYHLDGDKCPPGVSITIGELVKDNQRYLGSEPCSKCTPPDLDFMGPEESVRIEMNLYKLYWCRDATDVINTMYNHGRRDNRRPTKPSGLSIKLLNLGAEFDPDIKQAIMSMPR